MFFSRRWILYCRTRITSTACLICCCSHIRQQITPTPNSRHDLLPLAHTTTDHPHPEQPATTCCRPHIRQQIIPPPRTARHDLLPPAHTTNRTPPSPKTTRHDLLPPAHTTNRTPPSPKSARPICYSSRTNHRNKGDLMV